MQTRHFSSLPDKRLLNRGNAILNRLFSNSVHSIRQLAASSSEAKAMYRFLQNDKVSEADIIHNMKANCIDCVTDKSVLCIQDTTGVDLSAHENRLKKDTYIGTVNSSPEGGLGFFLHPSFVIDSASLLPYGFSDIKVWNRSYEKIKKEKSHHKHLLSIDTKESYKWIESSLNTKATLTQAQEIIIIQDREGDIYEQFCRVPDSKTHLLIRSRANRILSNQQRLFQYLSDLPSAGTYTIDAAGDKRRSTKKRKATIEVRFSPISIGANQYTANDLPPTISLYAIEAKEMGENSDNPIHWRLLTTRPVTDLATALQCIKWYTCRWIIEEVFRILKREGFDIESSELTQAKSIRKLSLMMLETIVRVFIMQCAYAIDEPVVPESCFSAQEMECLEMHIKQLEGRTKKLKNPYKPSDLKRYIWAIARMGGWKGYLSERPPGITTLWIGLQKFSSMMQGWLIFRIVSTR